MTISAFLAIGRRRWPMLLALPLLVALLSLAAGVVEPKHYAVSARAVVTRGVANPDSTAGMTWAREDTVAQDLPTIIGSAAFAREVATEIGVAGGALHASNDGKIVSITATAADPVVATATAQAAITLLQRNGLRYWGDPTWSPDTPGVNISPLDPPGVATAVPTTRDIVLDAGLRAAVGLIVALGLVAALEARRPNVSAK